MVFNVSLWDMSLWSAVSCLTVLTSAEFLSPYYGQNRTPFDPRRMRLVAVALGIMFVLLISSYLGVRIKPT